MHKTAIAVFSDPKAGSDEALGRLFNAMLVAYELKEKNQDVALIFQGAGTRWASELVKPDHPAHVLYRAIADKVVGVCGGCADVFGAADSARANAAASETPCGVIMNDAQALAMNMIVVPTRLRPSPRPRCTSGWNFPQP